MELYSRDEISEQKVLRKRAKTAAIAVSAAAAVLCVILLILVKPLNETLFRVIASVAAGIAGCVDIYVASFIMPYMRPKPKQRSAGGKVLHVLGNMLRQLHMYVIWVLLSAVLVSFLFNLATDTVPAKKVTIWVDTASVKEAELETVLNEDLPEGIKMTKVHTFEYSTFGMANVGADDIYIVRESDVPTFIEGFAPVLAMLEPRDIFEYYVKDGTAYGVKVYSAGSGKGCAQGYIDYSAAQGAEGALYEDCYLFFGKDCLHPGKDGAAAHIAEKLLKLQ